jgi:hypothetical protein
MPNTSHLLESSKFNNICASDVGTLKLLAVKEAYVDFLPYTPNVN